MARSTQVICGTALQLVLSPSISLPLFIHCPLSMSVSYHAEYTLDDATWVAALLVRSVLYVSFLTGLLTRSRANAM